jgi:undecaprenyl-phosphate 4-deoxy-4-formamido-L-arabinose transferase
MSTAVPEISLVIPVYNEEAVLPALFARLYAALDALGRSYEVIFVDDGSRDRSVVLLREQFQRRADVTRVVLFAANFGQHRAILAGFAHARGRYLITLDADLQNPPEETARLLAELDAGHDYVGTIREQRQDVAWRRWASRFINRLRERTTRIRITDQGCMFRGYARSIVDAINQCTENNTFVPALAYTFASSPTEINVRHEDRSAGESKYSVYRLIKLNFDLMTGFSTVPMQLFSALGFAVSILSVLFGIGLVVRRLVGGAEAAEQGIFTLFAIAFLLIGVTLFGLGLLGEYVGRIYEEVRRRPRYLIAAVLEQPAQPPPGQP